MEGVGAEAASLAGHLQLDNLCWIYDNNHITIEGNTRIAFTEDVAARFLGYQLERAARRRRQRPRAHRARAHGVQADQGPADADHPRHAHRLRLAAPAGHRGRARRAARRGGSEAHQARVRLAGGRAVPRARRRARALRAGIGARGAKAHARVERAVRASTARSIRRSPPEIEQMQKRELPDGWDRNLPRVPGRREGRRRPRRVEPGAERARAEHSVVPRRLGRPRPVEQDDAQVRRRGRLRARLATAAATCTTAFASTRWPRRSTACRCPSCGRSARPSSSSATMRARRSACRR